MKTTRKLATGGQSLVELALLLPLLILIFMFILDLGRVVYYYSALQNAVREGARYGVVFPEDITGIEAAVQEKAVGLGELDVVNAVHCYPFRIDDTTTDPNRLCCETTPIPACMSVLKPEDKLMEWVLVEGEFTFAPVTPLMGNFFGEGQSITLKSESTMRTEY